MHIKRAVKKIRDSRETGPGTENDAETGRLVFRAFRNEEV